MIIVILYPMATVSIGLVVYQAPDEAPVAISSDRILPQLTSLTEKNFSTQRFQGRRLCNASNEVRIAIHDRARSTKEALVVRTWEWGMRLHRSVGIGILSDVRQYNTYT